MGNNKKTTTKKVRKKGRYLLRKGHSAERELERIFGRFFFASRIPFSGVGKPLPDVVCFASGRIIGFEAKSTGREVVVFKRKDFDNLISFYKGVRKEGFNVLVFLAVRFKGGLWRFYKIGEDTEKVEANRNSGLSIKMLLDLLKKNGFPHGLCGASC